MAIPTFDKCLRPVLALAITEDITRRSATEAMIREFDLTPSEIEQRLPSGRATVIRNRTGWAMTFLTKGGLIAKVAPKTYRATDAGRDFLIDHPTAITAADLEAIPGYEEAWNTRAKRKDAVAGLIRDQFGCLLEFRECGARGDALVQHGPRFQLCLWRQERKRIEWHVRSPNSLVEVRRFCRHVGRVCRWHRHVNETCRCFRISSTRRRTVDATDITGPARPKNTPAA